MKQFLLILKVTNCSIAPYILVVEVAFQCITTKSTRPLLLISALTTRVVVIVRELWSANSSIVIIYFLKKNSFANEREKGYEATRLQRIVVKLQKSLRKRILQLKHLKLHTQQ